MTELPIWAVEAGVPSRHVASAAVRVARMIDPRGSEIAALRRSYRQHASGAYYSEPDMIKGEALLADCGLVRRVETRLVPTAELLALSTDDVGATTGMIVHALSQLPPDTDTELLNAVLEATITDPERREELLIALAAKYDDAFACEVGEIGEEIVVQTAKDQLLGLGRPELAAQVRRVSLQSDALGYDINAPRTTGSSRLLEVKASTAAPRVVFFLSRNEAEVGQRYPEDWFLVYCRIDDVERREGTIVGWCHYSAIDEHLPADRGAGTWCSVRVELTRAALEPGLPY